VHHPDSAQAARHAGLVLQLRGATIMEGFELASILVPPASRSGSGLHRIRLAP
jgi:hypothetical protein